MMDTDVSQVASSREGSTSSSSPKRDVRTSIEQNPPPIPPKRDVSDLELHLSSGPEIVADPPPLPPKKKQSALSTSPNSTGNSNVGPDAVSIDLIELGSPPPIVADRNICETINGNSSSSSSHNEQEAIRIAIPVQVMDKLGDYEDIWSAPMLERMKRSNAKIGTCSDIQVSGNTDTSVISAAERSEKSKSTHSNQSTETVTSFQVIWTPRETPQYATEPTMGASTAETNNPYPYPNSSLQELALGEIYAEPADAIPFAPVVPQLTANTVPPSSPKKTIPPHINPCLNNLDPKCKLVSETVRRASILSQIPLSINSSSACNPNEHNFNIQKHSAPFTTTFYTDLPGMHAPHSLGRLSRHYSDTNLLDSTRTSWFWSAAADGREDNECGPGPGQLVMDDLYLANLAAMYDNMTMGRPGPEAPKLPATSPPSGAAMAHLSLESLLNHLRSPSIMAFPTRI